MSTSIMGYVLEKTCDACPEQYDVFKDGEQVGYLRLRHGYFYASVVNKDVNYKVYTANTEGDGVFETWEREYHLTNAIMAIDKFNSRWSNERIK